MAIERLQKIMAAAGIASRRRSEQLMLAGRVTVNGQVVKELGAKADAGRDHIRVDGKLLHGPEPKIYLLLNKPRGYVTTVSDPEGRPTVMHLVGDVGKRLYPVGRLDYASEGLLLLTNDGELALKLTRAASHVAKTYLVKVSGAPTPETINRLRAGVVLRAERPGDRTVKTAPVQITTVREAENPWYEVTLTEGRNRQIRRMFEQVGHRVEKIKRVRYGPLELDVPVGAYRRLTLAEVGRLSRSSAASESPRRQRTHPRTELRTADVRKKNQQTFAPQRTQRTTQRTRRKKQESREKK